MTLSSFCHRQCDVSFEIYFSIGESGTKRATDDEPKARSGQEQESTWYHEGPDALRIARLWIANYSLPRARDRSKYAREFNQLPSAVQLQKKIQSLQLQCSQVGDTRPINSCNFNDDSSLLLTGSFTGVCKLWSVPDCDLVQTLKGHSLNIGGCVFRPGVHRDEDNVVSMACSCADDIQKKRVNR